MDEVDEGSVWMESEGRAPVRRRLAAGGLREGEAAGPDDMARQPLMFSAVTTRDACLAGLRDSHCSVRKTGRGFAVLVRCWMMVCETCSVWLWLAVDEVSPAIRDRR